MQEEDKLKIADLYIRGVPIKEIHKRLGKYNYECIKKYIQRNLKNQKEEHIRNRRYTYETLRRTKIECTNYISNMSFLKYNISAYKRNSRGDWIIDKKVVPIITFDTPKKIKNGII